MKKLFLLVALTLPLSTCSTQDVDSAISIFRGAVSGYETRRNPPVPATYYAPAYYPQPYQPTYH